MKTMVLLLVVSGGLLFGQTPRPQLPQVNPNGIWESSSGTRYALRLSGGNLMVTLAGSNPPFLQYELTLAQSKEEVNRYKGAGFFRATLKSGKECRFETDWEIVVFDEKTIIGNAPRHMEPDPQTCKPKETVPDRIELTKK
jgi:hypothetical protein